MKRAVIIGVLGQDGSYLAEYLDKMNYEVYGIVKQDTEQKRIDWIKGLVPKITVIRIDITNELELEVALAAISADEIYNFSGISNVFSPYEQTDVMMKLNAEVPMRILSYIIERCYVQGQRKQIRFFQASSCLVFGKTDSEFQDEDTPIDPIYPYGHAKALVDRQIKQAREAWGIYACSGIFYNHESPRRGIDFLSRKVTSGVARIKRGKQDRLMLGDLTAKRDMGYAPDFVKAAYLMLQQQTPVDYVIGTGKLISMQDFVKKCFEYVNLDPVKYVSRDENLVRRVDTSALRANSSKIKRDLGWIPEHGVDDIVKIMMDAEMSLV